MRAFRRCVSEAQSKGQGAVERAAGGMTTRQGATTHRAKIIGIVVLEDSRELRRASPDRLPKVFEARAMAVDHDGVAWITACEVELRVQRLLHAHAPAHKILQLRKASLVEIDESENDEYPPLSITARYEQRWQVAELLWLQLGDLEVAAPLKSRHEHVLGVVNRPTACAQEARQQRRLRCFDFTTSAGHLDSPQVHTVPELGFGECTLYSDAQLLDGVTL